MLAQALHASFADASEQRSSDRRVLRLMAQAATPSGPNDLQIHNLSRTGMLVECGAAVPVGTGIEVEMPGGARHRAEVVWQDTGLFGCRFSRPLSQATLSAAMLRAAPLTTVATETAPAMKIDAVSKLREHWDFEQSPSPASEHRLPAGVRLWTIGVLGLLCWAVPSTLLAWIVW